SKTALQKYFLGIGLGHRSQPPFRNALALGRQWRVQMFRHRRSCSQIRNGHVYQQPKRPSNRARHCSRGNRQRAPRVFVGQVRRLQLRIHALRQNRTRSGSRGRHSAIRRRSQKRLHLRRFRQLPRLPLSRQKTFRRCHPHLQTKHRSPSAVRQHLRQSRRSLHGLRRQTSRHRVL